MHILRFELRPMPSHKDFARLGGGTVTVVVDDGREGAAEALARALIERQQWVVTGRKESRHLDSAPDELRQAFQLAQRDGATAIFQTWPRSLAICQQYTRSPLLIAAYCAIAAALLNLILGTGYLLMAGSAAVAIVLASAAIVVRLRAPK